ncbi:MBG domain-containing protein, partial [Pontibacter sp. CAU 1760]
MSSKILLQNFCRQHHYVQQGVLVIVMLLLSAFGAHAQTVTSDKDDYAPGEVAIITGSGWTGDQMVHVEFKEEPDYPDYHVYDVEVNEEGNWVIRYDVETRHLGVTFTVTAVGKQSAKVATAVFTDALQITPNLSLTEGSSSTSSTATYTIVIKNTNTQNTTGALGSFRVLLPNGFSSPVVSAPNSGNKTWISDGYNATTRLISMKAYGSSDELKNQEELTFTVTTANPGTAGSYTWTTTGFGNRSYGGGAFEISAQPFTTIKANQIIVFSQLAQKTFGDATFSLSATSNSGLAVSYTSSNPNVATVSGSTVTIVGAGMTEIIASQPGNNTYSAAGNVAQNLTVIARPVTVKANNNTKVYGNALTLGTTAFSIDASTPMVSGQSIGAVTLNSAGATVNADVATYSIVPSAAIAGANTNLSNYNVTYSNGTLSVTPALATIMLSDLSKTYTGSAQGATITTSPANLPVNVTYNGSNTLPTKADTYAVIAVLNNSNYAASNATGTLTIDKANQTITWATPAAITYGAALSATQLNASVAGVAGGSAAGALGYNKAVGDVLNAGDHTLSVTAAATDNYNEATKTVSLKVNKAASTVAVTGDDTFTYNTSAQGPAAVTKTGSTGAVTYSYSG